MEPVAGAEQIQGGVGDGKLLIRGRNERQTCVPLEDDGAGAQVDRERGCPRRVDVRHGERLRQPRRQRRVGGARRRSDREQHRDDREAWAEEAPKIGPAAHVRLVSAADNRSAVDDRLPGVMAEIRSLLDLPAGAEPPPRADVEDTLTSGYAYALVLERDRLRLERELRALVRSSDRADQRKLAALSGRLDAADQELAGVRALLSTLRTQARS